ncbi:hypothetical protein CCP1ISM_90026 [Azospirillaceae bacterium]
MESKDYILSDGKKEFKVSKLTLNNVEWSSFLQKLNSKSVKIITTNGKNDISEEYIKNINIKKCVPLLNNNNTFPGQNDLISVVCGKLGNLYFRLHWALNSCHETSEFQNEIKTTPENIYSEFVKWWNTVKVNNKINSQIPVSKVNNNKFRINDFAAFLGKSIDYELKSEIKNEDQYNELHIKFIMPWTIATEICLYLMKKNVIGPADKDGFISLSSL